MKLLSASSVLLLALGAVNAHIGRGSVGHVKREPESNIHKVRRGGIEGHGHDHRLVARASPTTAAEFAKLTDPKEQCTPYYLPAMDNIIPNFPTTWTVADIMSGDTQALNIMKAINASGVIPTDIEPRNPAGDTSSYDIANDPDCWWTANTCTTPKHAGVLRDITTCQEPRTWGYTFDDGPNCTHNALYNAWAKAGQKVSLMYVGSNVMNWPLQAQRGIIDGHHICVHSWSHNYMTSLTTNQAFAELYYTIKIIKDIMGVTPTCWRPPFGDVDDRIRAIAQSLGLRTYMWSGNTNDWNIQPIGALPTASIKANYNSLKSLGAKKAAKTGGIIVLNHENNGPDMNLAIKELASIKKSWKNVVPLSACLNITKPYAEDITYPNFAQYIGGRTMPKNLPKPPVITNVNFTPQGSVAGGSGRMTTKKNGGPQK